MMIDNNILTESNRVRNILEGNSTISSISESVQPETVASLSKSADVSTITYQYDQFNHFDSQPNQIYFFVGATGKVWCAMTCTVNFASNVSTLGKTQLFFNTYNRFQQASLQHCVDLIKLLHMTANHSNFNNNVLSWLPSHSQDIYKMFMGSKHSIKTNLPVPTLPNIANTVCI